MSWGWFKPLRPRSITDARTCGSRLCRLPSLHQTLAFPLVWQARLDLQPETERSETLLTAMGRWRLPERGRTEQCMLIGMRLEEGSLGALKVLTPERRSPDLPVLRQSAPPLRLLRGHASGPGRGMIGLPLKH